MIDPLIAPTDMIGDIADAAPSRSSVTTVRSVGSGAATSSTGLEDRPRSLQEREQFTKAASVGGLIHFAIVA